MNDIAQRRDSRSGAFRERHPHNRERRAQEGSGCRVVDRDKGEVARHQERLLMHSVQSTGSVANGPEDDGGRSRVEP
jgi:hypothetical protein